MKNNTLKICLSLFIIMVIIAFFSLDLQQYVTLEYIKTQQHNFAEFYSENQLTTIAYFAAIYVTVTAFSLPGAAILTILAGALFGLKIGVLIVSPASTIGATIAFLIARFLLKDIVNQKFSSKLQIIDKGIEKEGIFYLFALRLVPIFPFFLINILMGLTKIKATIFFIISLLGMLPGTLIYIYAGTQLANIDSISDIASPSMIFALALLGLFPLITKKIVVLIRGL